MADDSELTAPSFREILAFKYPYVFGLCWSAPPTGDGAMRKKEMGLFIKQRPNVFRAMAVLFGSLYAYLVFFLVHIVFTFLYLRDDVPLWLSISFQVIIPPLIGGWLGWKWHALVTRKSDSDPMLYTVVPAFSTFASVLLIVVDQVIFPSAKLDGYLYLAIAAIVLNVLFVYPLWTFHDGEYRYGYEIYSDGHSSTAMSSFHTRPTSHTMPATAHIHRPTAMSSFHTPTHTPTPTFQPSPMGTIFHRG